MADVRVSLSRMLKKLFSRENLLAAALCAIVILVIVMTAATSPQWIYQGF